MKYKLTDETIKHNGITLYRIQALKDLGDVKAGDLGGWVESERNLSQDDVPLVFDNAWIGGDAKVFGNARVFGNAFVSGNARVSGNAHIYGNAQVSDNTWVYGNAQVSGYAGISGNVEVFGNTEIKNGSILG